MGHLLQIHIKLKRERKRAREKLRHCLNVQEKNKRNHLEAFLNDLGFFFSKVTECDSSSSFYTKTTQNTPV